MHRQCSPSKNLSPVYYQLLASYLVLVTRNIHLLCEATKWFGTSLQENRVGHMLQLLYSSTNDTKNILCAYNHAS